MLYRLISRLILSLFRIMDNCLFAFMEQNNTDKIGFK